MRVHPNLSTELDLLRRDVTSHLAAAALVELSQRDRETAAQDRLLEHLTATGAISYAELCTAYVEPQCVEHGLVHVRLPDNSDGSWVEVDPVSGQALRL